MGQTECSLRLSMRIPCISRNNLSQRPVPSLAPGNLSRPRTAPGLRSRGWLLTWPGPPFAKFPVKALITDAVTTTRDHRTLVARKSAMLLGAKASAYRGRPVGCSDVSLTLLPIGSRKRLQLIKLRPLALTFGMRSATEFEIEGSGSVSRAGLVNLASLDQSYAA
jgi:hypothetical protein